MQYRGAVCHLTALGSRFQSWISVVSVDCMSFSGFFGVLRFPPTSQRGATMTRTNCSSWMNEWMNVIKNNCDLSQSSSMNDQAAELMYYHMMALWSMIWHWIIIFCLSLQIRGFLSRFDNVLPASLAFDKCTACSPVVSHVTVYIILHLIQKLVKPLTFCPSPDVRCSHKYTNRSLLICDTLLSHCHSS